MIELRLGLGFTGLLFVRVIVRLRQRLCSSVDGHGYCSTFCSYLDDLGLVLNSKMGISRSVYKGRLARNGDGETFSSRHGRLHEDFILFEI